MKIVRLMGGLGNQLFQYVFAKRLEKETGDVVMLDDTFFDCCFDDELYQRIAQPRIYEFSLSLDTISKDSMKDIARKYSHFRGYNRFFWDQKDRTFSPLFCRLRDLFRVDNYFEYPPYGPVFDKIKHMSYFVGYYGQWENVDVMWDIVKKDFVPKNPVSDKTLRMIDKVKNENSVFVGVRRGDYVRYRDIYGEFSQDYYDKTMKYMAERVESPVFYIFSDDIDWVEKNMDFQKWKAFFRRDEDIVTDFEELMIMANCKHSIVINSTYQWWGARLNYYPGKIVIAPKQFFVNGWKENIFPHEWVRM